MDWMSTDNRLSARVPLDWSRLTQTAHAAEAAWENVSILLDQITAGERTWDSLGSAAPLGRIRVPPELLDALSELTPLQIGGLMNAALKPTPNLWQQSDDPAGLAHRRGVTVLLSPDGGWLIRRALVLSAQAVPLTSGRKRPRLRWLNLPDQLGDLAPLWWARPAAGGEAFLVMADSLREAWEKARDPHALHWYADAERLQRLQHVRASL